MNVSTPIEKQNVHAHRCEKCAASGKEVYWIHKDDCKGALQAHKCPECGTVEWRKALIEPARLPKPPEAAQANGFDTFLYYAVICVGFFAFGYLIFEYWPLIKSYITKDKIK